MELLHTINEATTALPSCRRNRKRAVRCGHSSFLREKSEGRKEWSFGVSYVCDSGPKVRPTDEQIAWTQRISKNELNHFE